MFERNRPGDTFGWGVVLLRPDDGEPARPMIPISAQSMTDALAHWDDIDVHVNGAKITSGGHGFIGIGRKHLLQLLQARARELGVVTAFRNRDRAGLRGAEGLRSRHRLRRHQQQVPRGACGRVQGRDRNPRQPFHLVRHASALRRVQLHLQANGAWLDLGARLSVRQGHRDLHRRMRAGDLRQVRLRRNEPGRDPAASARESSRTIWAATN